MNVRVLTLRVLNDFRIVGFEDGNAGVGGAKINSNDAITKESNLVSKRLMWNSALRRKNESAAQPR